MMRSISSGNLNSAEVANFIFRPSRTPSRDLVTSKSMKSEILRATQTPSRFVLTPHKVFAWLRNIQLNDTTQSDKCWNNIRQ